MIKVVCGIIYKGESILIAKRRNGKSLAGKWEFPGGKVENDETEKEALKRELLEELGMNLAIHSRLGTNIYDYGDFKINLVAYKCQFIAATFTLTDHDKVAWVKKEDLLNYDLAEADVPLLDFI